MAVNPENSLFVEAVNTEEQGHDANLIAQELERVMELLQCNVSGAITDSMSDSIHERSSRRSPQANLSMDASTMGSIY